MGDAGEQGGADAATTEEISEVERSGSVSRKGSGAPPAVDQSRLSADTDVDLSTGDHRLRGSSSSVRAPSSGGNDSVGSLHEDAEGTGSAGMLRKVSVVPTVEGEDEGYKKVAEWVKEHLVLPEFAPEKHWCEEHDEVVMEFAKGASGFRLFAAMVESDLVVTSNPAKFTSPGGAAMPKVVNYFVRPEGATLSLATVKDVQYGLISGQAVHSLLQLLHGVFSPKVFKRQAGWPESVKNDLTGHFHRFMASLVEMSNQAKGKTVMYLPAEMMEIGEDLVQHLESIVIHWTRQIKDVVNNHDNALSAEILGPLEEIEVVVSILDTANSSYLAPFNVLSQRIKEGSVEANNNLKFLESITTPCQNLTMAKPKEIPALLPGLLSCIRMIWNLSKFYNTEERLTGLLRKISNEIIHRCCAEIDLGAIFDGDIDAAMTVLNESRACGVEWKAVYRRTAMLVRRSTVDPSRHWDFDDASIFAQIDAFIQRCSELLEVCESQIQLARKTMGAGGGASGPLPEFGGTRGQEITKALLGIQDSFEAQIEKLRNLDYTILDVTTSRWHDDYNSFKDVMYTNVINTAFEGITRITDAVALLEIFYTLARRDAIKQTCLKKTAYTYMLFVRYVEGLRHEFDENRRRPPLRPNEPPFAGSAVWAHSLARGVEEAWSHLKNLRHMAKASLLNCAMASDEAEAGLTMGACKEAQAAYTVFVTVVGDFKANRYQAWVDHLNSVIEVMPLGARLDVPLLRRASMSDLDPRAPAQQQKLLAAGEAGKGNQASGQPSAASGGGKGGPAAVTAATGGAMGRSGPHQSQHLVCNFDLDLLALFSEVSHWEKFQGEFSVPYAAHDICNQREKLREQREHVMLVVRAYNSILDELDPSERKLFSDNIRRLDKRIHQGMTKLTWSTKGIVEFYVRDCCNHAAETKEIVRGVHRQKEAVVRQCRMLSSLQLTRIDKNVVYDDREFAKQQADHCVDVRAKMKWAHDMVLTSMREIFACFEGGSSEVKRERRALIAQTDNSIELALRNTVKKSVQLLSKAINGDAKTDPQTLFKVNIVLESAQVDYRPTMINLTHVINIVTKELMGTIKAVSRVRDALGDSPNPNANANAAAAANANAASGRKSVTTNAAGEPVAASPVSPGVEGEVEGEREGEGEGAAGPADQPAGEGPAREGGAGEGGGAGGSLLPVAQVVVPSFYNIISNDEDTLKIVVQIMNGMSASAAELQKYLSYWDKYKYRELQADIVQEESSHTINFIKIDCTQLKTALVGHCSQWQAKLTGLLNQNAMMELRGLHELFETSTARLKIQPTNLDHLSESWNLLETMKKDVPTIEAKFGPLEETYAILAKFEVSATEEEQKMLQDLEPAGEEFKDMLKEMLNKSKVNMKRDLENSITNYNESVLTVHQDASTYLPYSGDMKPGKAFEIIEEYKAKVEAVRTTQAAMQAGLDVFAMDSPEHKELKEVERDLNLMEQIWTVSQDWETAWDGWKTGLFTDLDVEEMEMAAGTFTKKIGKLGRDMKKWKVWEAMKEKVEQFRQTMPLIQDLKNPALRPRHWDALRSELGKNFDPEAADFNLEGVFSLGLHNLAEFIGDLSTNANKELGIEQSLVDVEHRWKDIDIDMCEYKDKYYKIKSTEDLFQVLEEDSVQLSTIKASKFYNSFAEKIDKWEKALNGVSETVDLILNVQKKWMYLESIFMASEDICKQLPRESAIFMEVNAEFSLLMEAIFTHPNAIRACCTDPKMTEKITAMDSNLEIIQKSLDQYLETKRMVFPRFYFVSDDDLLEILGQSKDPEAVQKHLKKCFEGIKDIHLIPPGKHMNKTWEASGLTSPDGETVELANNLVIDGAVEMWLAALEGAMQTALQKLLASSLQAYKGKKDKWVKEYQGQLLISTGAVQWTTDCSKALNAISGGNKTALKALKKKQVGYLNKMSDMVRGQLTKIERNKLVALITMEIHNRDVMERMIKAGCAATSDFEWLSQLRFVFAREDGPFGMCSVRQTNCQLEYSYEYQDLGKNLAKYVVVINCSDGQDYKSVGRIFSGLVQSGSWGCFDEFNRIKIEVISVVAVQVLSILNALSAHKESLMFMGNVIKCNPNCGIFITMNPGYAGRTELPDNLKALMRPVAMMTPDLAMIAEVMLAAEGFREARILAKKTVTLYSLMIQQLSKQDHYDYGLRNLKAVLNMAGALKRADPNMNEEAILMRALRDMNLPKFIKDDERLFRLLLGDLFPSLELPVPEYGALQVAVEAELTSKGLQQHPFLIMKIIQLSDSQLTRHCNMLVGRTMSGKSVAWKTLMNAKTQMCKDGVDGFHPVQPLVINPKSVTLSELYGAYDLSTFEWADGILSTLFKQSAESDKPDEKWIMFDGPIDALWIESMNSVMDDNKILTLINGDRIPLTSSMSLLFEVEDLAVASPATVSRAGMIFLDVDEMGWQPFVNSWLQQRFGDDAEHLKFHRNLFSKYVEGVLAFKEANVTEPVPVGDFNAVQSLCTLYDAFRDNPATSGLEQDAEGYLGLAEKWFVFSMVWSVMAAADEDGRAKLDAVLRDVEAQFPPSASVYDYYVDPKKLDWELWEPKVPPFRYLKTMPFHKMIVPTVDTIRNSFVLGTLWGAKRNALVVGSSGAGKTVLAFSELARLPETHSQLVMNFSATTDSGTTQARERLPGIDAELPAATIEQTMEKRSKDKFGPLGGKQLVIFLDDFNMPMRISHESPFQPPLELLRFWMDYGGWYDRAKCAWRYILDTQLICAMAPPGGARAVISARTQSRFNVLNLTVPNDSQIIRIFDSILAPKLADFDVEVKPLAAHIAQATLRVYQASTETFLPTPVKSHYLFNMRDVAKVIEGVMQATPRTVDTKEAAIRLWAHECQRVFSDRFVQDAADDQGRFREVINGQLKATFSTDWAEQFSSCEDEALGSVFTACFGEGDEDTISYEEQLSLAKLRQVLEERLEDYNMEPKLVSMQLVLFKDAVCHVARIHRVLSLKRGNLMLVGVGGSGRQSLTRLAAYICGQELFTIEIAKNYRQVEFREDLKVLFEKAAVGGKPVTFLFNDNQIKEECFLEDINNVLQSGEVPNLYGKDEIGQVLDGVRKTAKKAGIDETTEALWAFFVDRVRENLHVVLAMSPIGESFRNRTRMYPGLVNCTTIDWFQPWPADALVEVATKFIQDIPMDDESRRVKVASVFSSMHTSVVVASAKMLVELKRYNYVTPTNFLELVKVETMSVELEAKKITVATAQKDCEELLVEIVSERRVEQESERIGKDAMECQVIADDAQADLAVAMPALEKAMMEVDKLDKTSITEVKAYSKPPPLVETVMAAVMILMGRGSDWATAKKALGEGNFLTQIKTFNKDNVSNSLMTKVKKYINNPDFSFENVAKVSSAASALCVWVHAIYLYANVAKDVAPKRARLKEAQETLATKQAGLKAAQDQLAEVVAKVQLLKDRYDESVGQKNALMEESQMLQDKLERADKLVSGLAGEFVRWQASIGTYEAMIERLVGDSLIAAAFLSYAGTFDTIYRNELVSGWMRDVDAQELPSTEGFSFTEFLAKPTDVRAWNIQGLPKDDFSTENGVMVTRGSRWPLMIDPQGQANKWIKAMEGKNLTVVDLNTKDFLRQMGNCIQYGLPCLLQDVLEELDPSIEPVLSKAIIKQGNREVVRLGDKELDWSHDFRLYITTKLGNPHYTPEVSTKTTVVNFSVKQLGLEAQLLGIVVQREQPSLEEQSSELTVKVATGKKKIADLEDEILRLLSESTGSLLDDMNLVNTLQDSKTISEEVTQQLQVAEETAVKIDSAREGYRSAAIRASVAYFVLDDLSRVDPMYQLCFRILEQEKKVPSDEFNFLLYGGIVVERSGQRANPCKDWVDEGSWDNITELDNLAAFSGLALSFEQTVFNGSTPKTPLIFVLSPGVDPTAQVQSLSEAQGVKMSNVALGQGQAPAAIRMIEDGVKLGHWVFLANCHLMLSWMPDLEKIVEDLCIEEPHEDFRLWLSSGPHPKFPISILRRGLKMTTEPPAGLRANVSTLYNIVSPEQFNRCGQTFRYRKLLFSLAWFHAILLERRKFKSLGFNVPYEFNESDFSICHDLVIVFLDEYPEKPPFEAMRYLIAEANYGGRVTDEWDRRLVNVYMNQYFCPAAIDEPNFLLSELKEYYVPPDGDLQSYKEFIKRFPKTDHPAAFGQHVNADITSLIEDTNALLGTMVSLAPKAVSAGGETNEEKISKQADLLSEQVPKAFNIKEVKSILAGRSDPDPMKTVLLQEAERYNALLLGVARQLADLKKAVKGLVVVTPELEEISQALLQGKVPASWSKCYPSLKPLGAWMRDLIQRAEHIRGWAMVAMPKVFWLPCMTYPSGFLTALLQTSARKNGIAIDTLSWEFSVLGQDTSALSSYPKEGAYCEGLFLDGARWNRQEGCLEEPPPMELFYQMPVIHFKPVESKKKASKGVYVCPTYMYPLRTGSRERPSFVIAAELRAGKHPSEFWTKRGVAMLLSIAV
eukprot:g8879.t1